MSAPAPNTPRLARHALLACASVALVVGIVRAQEVALTSLRVPIEREFPEVPFITPEALAGLERLEPARRPRLVDARTPDEFAVSHLRGAVRIDPDRPDVHALGVDRRVAVVVYCAVGYRSARVARALMRAGFTDVSNLEEGIFGWANRGLPVYRGNTIVHDVHPYDDTWGRMLRPALRTRTPR